MRLGPRNLGGLSSLQTNSPSTNPDSKVVRFCESANALLKKSAGFAGKGEQFVAIKLVLLLPGKLLSHQPDVRFSLTHHLHRRPAEECGVYVDMEDDAGHGL